MNTKAILFAAVLLAITNCEMPTISFAQGAWASKTSLPSGGGTAVAFAIGGLGYLGTGSSGFGNNFWQYDPIADTWTQKVSCGGGTRAFAAGFSIGNYGYIGMGQGSCGSPLCNDFWRYDPVLNSWTQTATYPGTGPGSGHVSFAMNGKGYLGSVGTAKAFYEYDPVLNSWTKKNDFPGSWRADLDAASFSIGTKGYCGTGHNGIALNDFWEYDPAIDTWTQKANVPGTKRLGAVGFGICNKGFMGFGWDYPSGSNQLKDLWMYDPVTDSWSACTTFPSTGGYDMAAFVINNKAYLGTGWIARSDFWEYAPDTAICSVLNVITTQTNLFCNGQCIGTATVTPTSGAVPYTYAWSPAVAGQTTQVITGLCAGTYSVLVTDGAGNTATAAVTITQPTILTATATSTPSLCGNNNGAATITASGGTPGYTYIWSPSGGTNATATGLGAGTYTATITDANGCTQTQTVTVVSSGSSITTNQSASICTGSTYSLPGGTVVSTGGIYIDTLTSAGGCDSIITTTLTVDSVLTSNQSASICSGFTYTLPGGTVVSTSGIYIDTLTSAGGCDSIITTTLTVDSVLTSNQSAGICIGSTYTLPGGTIVSTGGAYNDTLTSVGGCDSIITTTLTLNPNPTAIAFSNVTITQGQNATLTASGGGTYSWSNGTNGSSIIVVPPVTTLYCVMVTDTNNCTDTTCVTVTIEPIDCSNAGKFYLPNAFSPNGDGENDKLQIYYGNIKCIKTFNLTIYNRWGEEVFVTTNPIEQWDGSYKGRIESAAAFVYYLQAALISGEEITRKGNVSLLR